MTMPSTTHHRLPERIRTGARIAAVLATALILWATLSPGVSPPGPTLLSWSDKFWHILAFVGWAGLVRLAWRGPNWAVIVAGAVFGGAIEIIQPLTGRGAELADLIADIAGCAVGVWIAGRVQRRLPGATDSSRA